MTLTEEQRAALRARRQAKIAPAQEPEQEPEQELEQEIRAQDDIEHTRNGYGADVERQQALERIAQEYEQEYESEEYLDAQDIPLVGWEGKVNFDSGLASMLAPTPVQPMQLVRGFAVKPGMTPEQLEDLSEMIHTYIGVIPRRIGNYAGRWVKVIGCVVQPVAGTKNTANRLTGEVEKVNLQWDVPLFKLASVDQDTGMHIVVAGGGRYGLQFAMEMTALFGPGDWKHPRMMFVSQEERTGIDEDGKESPRRMYRFNHRRPTSEDK